LQEDPYWRLAAIILAMLTDCLDGYCARRYKMMSRLGTFMDPFADKFFVFTALAVLISEQRLLPWEALSMLCRDFSVFIFGCYLAWKGVLGQYQFRAIWCGKVTTPLQLIAMGPCVHKCITHNSSYALMHARPQSRPQSQFF